MTVRTAVEMKADNIAAMGDPLGALYSELWQQTGALYGVWVEYVELFGTSPETVDLLNATIPGFVHVMQEVLWRDVLLSLSRLTDPPKSAGKQNLTIQALAPAIGDPTLRARVQRATDKALNATAFARDWRNRYLAHNELVHSLDHSAEPLLPASRLKVRHALRWLEIVMDQVSEGYGQGRCFFRFGPSAEAGQLLYYLREGQEARRARFDRMRNQVEGLQ